MKHYKDLLHMGSRDKSRLSEQAVFQQLIISSDSRSYSFIHPLWGSAVRGDIVCLRRGTTSLAYLRLLWLFVFVFLKQRVVLNDKRHKVGFINFSPLACIVVINVLRDQRSLSVIMRSSHVETRFSTIWSTFFTPQSTACVWCVNLLNLY